MGEAKTQLTKPVARQENEDCSLSTKYVETQILRCVLGCAYAQTDPYLLENPSKKNNCVTRLSSKKSTGRERNCERLGKFRSKGRDDQTLMAGSCSGFRLVCLPFCKRSFNISLGVGGGGGVLPIMAFTGRLRPKGVSFSGFRYMKGKGFHKLR